jgi:hypothetical protein
MEIKTALRLETNSEVAKINHWYTTAPIA